MTPEQRRIASSERRHKATVRRQQQRLEAAELEARADRIMRTAAITELEAHRLYARAAVLRMESDG